MLVPLRDDVKLIFRNSFNLNGASISLNICVGNRQCKNTIIVGSSDVIGIGSLWKSPGATEGGAGEGGVRAILLTVRNCESIRINIYIDIVPLNAGCGNRNLKSLVGLCDIIMCINSSRTTRCVCKRINQCIIKERIEQTIRKKRSEWAGKCTPKGAKCV